MRVLSPRSPARARSVCSSGRGDPGVRLAALASREGSSSRADGDRARRRGRVRGRQQPGRRGGRETGLPAHRERPAQQQARRSRCLPAATRRGWRWPTRRRRQTLRRGRDAGCHTTPLPLRIQRPPLPRTEPVGSTSELVAKSITQCWPRVAGVFAREGTTRPALELVCPSRPSGVGVGHGGLVQTGEKLSSHLSSVAGGQAKCLPKNGLGVDRHRRQRTVGVIETGLEVCPDPNAR